MLSYAIVWPLWGYGVEIYPRLDWMTMRSYKWCFYSTILGFRRPCHTLSRLEMGWDPSKLKFLMGVYKYVAKVEDTEAHSLPIQAWNSVAKLRSKIEGNSSFWLGIWHTQMVVINHLGCMLILCSWKKSNRALLMCSQTKGTPMPRQVNCNIRLA